jgi:NADP-dependent 3-hydroxy acid dehydrogenase YdfG
VEPGAMTITEISLDRNQEGARAMYEKVEALTAQDIADVIAVAVGRPRRVAINEVLIRPSKQPL